MSMNTVKQVRKQVDTRIRLLIEKLEETRAELGSWEPDEDDDWLVEELSDASESLSELIEMIDQKAIESPDEDIDDEETDEDEEDDGVKELDGDFGFGDEAEDD